MLELKHYVRKNKFSRRGQLPLSPPPPPPAMYSPDLLEYK